MEQITISKLIKELTALKQLHGDLKVYHIAYGSVEQIYTVKVDVILKKEKDKQTKQEAVLLY